MGKKRMVFCFVIILVIICGAYLVSHYYNPEPFNEMGRTMLQYGPSNDSVESRSRNTQRIKLFTIAGIFLFAGSMFWIFFLKTKKGSHADGATKNAMTSTSLRDYTIALLVISVGLILPILLAVLFGFSHFW